MTENSTNSSKSRWAGPRCQICTGCGRCAGREGAIRIIGRREADPGLLVPMGELTAPLAAADIGTTTIAMELYLPGGGDEPADRFVAVNPQRAFGPDVLSRIRAAEDPLAAKRMRRDVREVLREGGQSFLKGLGRDAGSRMTMAVAANTTMTYLLLGHPPGELGRAPFHAAYLEEARLELEGIPTVVLPGLSAFVGGDILAGIYATGMWKKEGVSLLIDLGTNGELAIGNRERILASATAAGPAFEGGAARGIWGSDMISLVSRLLRENAVDETGLLVDRYFDDGIRIGDVTVTQQAIRSLQMAKGAIAAGIDILASRFGLSSWEEVDEVVLAGGFGYYLKPQDAVEIGLIPKGLEHRVRAGGNTSLAGAARYGRDCRIPGEKGPKELRKFLKGATETINLAEDSSFEERYIGAMNLEKR